MMECEGHLLTAFLNRMMLPPEQRSEKAVKEAIEALGKPLKVLDDHLKGREYLLGKEFTVADLNVAGVLILLPMLQIDMASTPNARAWLDRCLARPALERARAKG